MTDLFGELTGEQASAAAEGAARLGAEPSHGPGDPAAAEPPVIPADSTHAIEIAKREVTALNINTDFKVATAEDATAAAIDLGVIKGLHGRLEDERKERTRPLNEQIRSINAEYQGPRDLLISAEETIKRALLEFRGAEQKRIEEARRTELKVAAEERARLEQQAREERERAERKAADLMTKGKIEQAEAVRQQADLSAAAKERTAALVAAPRGAPDVPTKLGGTSFRKVWKAKVTNTREFLAGLLKSPYAVEQIVTIEQRQLDKLASTLQDKMDTVLPGAIAWQEEGVAARGTK
jgi:hypothetical protein